MGASICACEGRSGATPLALPFASPPPPLGGKGAPSGTLPLNALLPALLIFLLRDPHLLESALDAGDDIGHQGSHGD